MMPVCSWGDVDQATCVDMEVDSRHIHICGSRGDSKSSYIVMATAAVTVVAIFARILTATGEVMATMKAAATTTLTLETVAAVITRLSLVYSTLSAV